MSNGHVIIRIGWTKWTISGSIKERLEPSDTVRLVKAINALPDIISLNDIPHYINKKWQEKIKLDEDINYKKRESEKLDQEIEKEKRDPRFKRWFRIF